MIRRAAVSLLCAAALTGCMAGRETRGAVALFDGHSLAGWEAQLVSDNESATPLDRVFQVRDGAIHVYADAPQGSAQPHAVLVSATGRDNYRFHLDYRWGPNTYAVRLGKPKDAGILLLITPERPGLIETWYRWPMSLEYQIMEGDSGSAYLLKARAAGSVDPATRAYLPAERGGVPATARLIDRDMTSFRLARGAAAAERPGWNSVDVEVRGANARFFLNGVLVNEVWLVVEDRDGEPVPMANGRIALQAESAQVEYRNIRIEPLRRR